MEQDVTPDPGDKTLFYAKRVVLASYGLTNPIPDEVFGEELLGMLFHDLSRCY